MYNKMFECTNCGKKFDHKSRYDVHLNKINPCTKKSSICEFCHKDYSSISVLNRHLKTCKISIVVETKLKYERKIDRIKEIYLNERLEALNEENMRLKNEIILLKSQTRNITINGDVDSINNGTVINKVSNREKYTHVFPLGKFKTDVVVNICVENARICDKLKIALGKGDVINPVLIIYKAVHMNSTYNEYKNISYKDGQFMAIVENQGWIPVSWEFICEKIYPEIDIVLRRTYDKMEYGSKKGNRAKNALESFYKMSIADIKELKNKVKETSTRVFNNHNIVGIISAESSKSSTDSYEYDSDSYESDEESS